MNRAYRILMVEDSPDDSFFVERELEKAGLKSEIVRIESPGELKDFFDSDRKIDIVLTDYNLPGWNGLDVVEKVLFYDPILPVILLSGRVGEERAVEVIRSGARDYVSKDAVFRLPAVIRREVRDALAERRELEMADRLKESEARFSQVFAVSPDPMAVTGGRDFKIRDVNNAFCEVSGREAPSLIGTSIFSIIGRGEEPSLLKEKLLSGGVLRNHEISLNDTAGRVHTALWSADGRVFGKEADESTVVLWIGKDISEKMEIEKKLRDSERLRSLGTLSGGIAHDFNNILMVMMGYTEMATAKTQEPRLRRYLDEIYTAVQRAQELIHQIITFSRGTEGQRKLMDPVPVVKEVLKLIRPSLPSTIEIEERIESTQNILGDPSHIHQIVMNLCTNSYQAMKEEYGRLIVFLKDVEEDGQRFVCLEVVDTGPGMEEEVLKRIYEPFFTTKLVGEGTGLGLSVVHGIVESYDGNISIDTTPGEGTRIRILLPASVPESIVEEKFLEERTWQFRGGKILIVDDESKVAEVVSLMVEDLGYTVTAKLSPEEGLAELLKAIEADQSYDLLITDLTMPGMTGLQMAERIRGFAPDLPIILCSGYYETMEQSIDEHIIDAVLPKPANQATLAEIIDKLVQAKKERVE